MRTTKEAFAGNEGYSREFPPGSLKFTASKTRRVPKLVSPKGSTLLTQEPLRDPWVLAGWVRLVFITIAPCPDTFSMWPRDILEEYLHVHWHLPQAGQDFSLHYHFNTDWRQGSANITRWLKAGRRTVRAGIGRNSKKHRMKVRKNGDKVGKKSRENWVKVVRRSLQWMAKTDI